MFLVDVESEGSRFPVVRLLPTLSGRERAVGRTGKLREYGEILTALRVQAATRCRLAGHAGSPLTSLDGWRLAVQVPADDLQIVCAGLSALISGDERPLREYVTGGVYGPN